MLGPLGRLVPPDFNHVAKYPLKTMAAFIPRPVVVGVNWYPVCDNPIELADGSFHISPNVQGSPRGGHCFCLVPMGKAKSITDGEWTFYDQGMEGACEGFGHARGQTLQTGKTFDAFWLFDDAQRVEGTYVPNGGSVENGSTNISAVKALIQWGAHYEFGTHCHRSPWSGNSPSQKAKSVRWTKDTAEVLEALGRPNADAVPFVNSWGRGYPKLCWLPITVLDRLLAEEGEADVTVD